MFLLHTLILIKEAIYVEYHALPSFVLANFIARILSFNGHITCIQLGNNTCGRGYEVFRQVNLSFSVSISAYFTLCP